MKTNTIITIGREFGSAGREIGYKVAKEFGIKLYDKEMLARAAKESGICEEIFESHDEKPTSSFLYSLVMDTYSMGYSGICRSIIRFFLHSLMQSKKSQMKDLVFLSEDVQIMHLNHIKM